MKTSTDTFVLKSEMDIPEAWVAIKRNRQKNYNGQGQCQAKNQVYLKDGQEFQIELFNPTQTKLLVKIKINGNYSSNRGLILNPGQRYFLERFIDEDRKLAFSTYEVENDKQAKKAIEKNGLLEVEFYAETVFNGGYLNGNWSYLAQSKGYMGNPITFSSGTNPENLVNCVNGTCVSTTGSSINYSGSVTTSYFSNTSSFSSIVKDDSIETGRVERGEKSNQSFEDGYGNFNSWASFFKTIQIIPMSQKPVESQEIRSYCTGCGSRIKKQTWKFCPNCGTENI
jgi:hypothetical protein